MGSWSTIRTWILQRYAKSTVWCIRLWEDCLLCLAKMCNCTFRKPKESWLASRHRPYLPRERQMMHCICRHISIIQPSEWNFRPARSNWTTSCASTSQNRHKNQGMKDINTTKRSSSGLSRVRRINFLLVFDRSLGQDIPGSHEGRDQACGLFLDRREVGKGHVNSPKKGGEREKYNAMQ